MKNLVNFKQLLMSWKNTKTPQKLIRYAAMLLMLLTLGVGQMWGDNWIGGSYIVVNGTWYNANGSGQSAGDFNSHDFGTITSLTLGGEVQTYGQSDGKNNPATMYYKFDDQSANAITLYWFKYSSSNNYFHSNSDGSTSDNNDFASKTIDISGLSAGNHKLRIYFYSANLGIYDSNNSKDYVADFTIAPKVTFSASPAGAASAPTNNAGISSGDAVTSGTSITFTHATANTGYTWSHWEDGAGNNLGTGSTYTASSISAHTNVIAVYTENSYSTTIVATNGSTSPSGSPQNISQITGNTLTASPNTGYIFTTWSVSGGGLTMTEAATSATNTFKATSTGGTITASFDVEWNIKGGNSGSSDSDGDAMGDWNTYNALTGASDTALKCTLSLAANTSYHFKVVRRTDNDNNHDEWWGNNSAFVGQSSSLTMSTSDGNCHLTTAGAGNYIFTYNSNDKTLTVTYPSVSHPSTDYVYYSNPYNWATVKAHIFTGSTPVDTWDSGEPTLNSFTFDGKSYYYAALGGETSIIFKKDGSNKTGDLTTASSNKGKYYNTSWSPFTATLTLNHHDATNTPAPNSITVTYKANTNLTGDVISTSPTKTGYTFDGYYTAKAGGGVKLIGSDENVVASVTNYTDASKNWIHGPNPASETVYAKWKQSVTLNGNSATTAGSANVEAVYYSSSLGSITNPGKAGYTFGGWYTADDGSGSMVINTSGAMQKPITNWTDATNGWIRNNSSTLYAKWSQNITLDANTANHGSGSNTTSTSVILNATAVTGFAATAAATGYHVEGYYTAATSGTKVLNADGSFAGSSVTDYITSSKWIKAGATTLYAHYEPNTYDVILNVNGATSGSNQTVVATYDAAMPTAQKTSGDAITAPSKTGYTFDGYTANDDGTGTKYYTNALASNHAWDVATNNTNIYAKWNANSYTITLSQSGETGYGSAGTTNVSATYDADMPSIANVPTATNGYKFVGYYTASNGSGTQYTEADGTWIDVADYIEDGKWVNAGTLTLYAYFKKAAITDLTYSTARAIPGGDVDITPVIAPIPEGSIVVCWGLYYDAACTEAVPEANYTIAAGEGNSITLTAPTAAGTYYIQATLRTGSSCEGGTLLSTLKKALIVESDHKVTVKYVSEDGEVLAEDREVVVPAGDSIGVKAPTIDGYTFSEWNLGDVLQRATDDATGDSITIKAQYDGALTATYVETPRVYFYNNLGWSEVYVTFDANWHDTYGSGNSGKWYFHMTHIEGTDIWYSNVPSHYTSNNFEHWSSTITFNNTQFGSDGYSSDAYRKEYFNSGHAVYRKDFDPYNTMFVPAPESIVSHYDKNGVAYYSTDWTYYDTNPGKEDNHRYYYHKGGYWKKYNKTYSGYSLRGTFANIVGSESNWDGSNHNLYSESIGDSVFTTSLQLNGNYNYYFRIYRNVLKISEEISGYTNNGAMTLTGSHSDWRFETKSSWHGINCTLTTATAGVYTFKVTFKKNGTIYVTVEYPETSGDYQVLYSDNTTSEWFTSNVIPSDATNSTVSFFYRPGNSPTLKWKKSMAISNTGVITWGSDNIFDMSSFSSVLDNDSVYAFYVSIVDGALQIDSVKAYTGNYYIRTDIASKYKWDHYTDADHLMTYSEYSEKNSNFTHYHTHYAPSGTNVKFVVANDYSPYISDTLIQMASDVSVSPAFSHVNSEGTLDENANVRFMWNSHTNEVRRAYLAVAKEDGSHFLVMQGEAGKLLAPDGSALVSGNNRDVEDNAIQFKDDENWIYEAEVQAKPGARIKLYARFDGEDHYYRGDSDASFDGEHGKQLIGGTSGDPLSVRVIYDFKTDRLMAGYVPNGSTISDTLPINADIMLIRNHQEAPEAIVFGESSGKLDKVQIIYGVMRFNRWLISNRESNEYDSNPDYCHSDNANTYHPLLDVEDMMSEYERSFYFISFPFDVNLSEVIGFGTYGVHWGIMYYDGKGRAQNGYWADSEVNWKYFTQEEMRTKKLNAYEGYVIGIDPYLMYYNNEEIWTNHCSNLEMFFPSAAPVSAITKQEVTVTIDQTGYECKIDRRSQADKDAGINDINQNRTIADSYWHCIGVPTYANIEHLVTGVTSETENRVEWGEKGCLYVYNWSRLDNSMSAVPAGSYEFETMKSYLVQYAGETITWAAAAAGPRAIVARQQEEDIQAAEFGIELLRGAEKQDQTYVRLTDDENVTTNFDFNYDLTKAFNAGKANIYTIAEGYVQAAANCLPLSEQTTIVPVGVKIATSGEYTFSIPSGTSGVGVVLVDNILNTRTNLGLTDYTVNLSAGQIDGRFLLEISPFAQTPTDIEPVSEIDDNATKRIVDGKLYIIKNKKVFDATGTRVQ